MKFSCIICPQADKDIVDAALSIADDSLESAGRFIDAMESAIEELCRIPKRGNRREARHPDLSSLRVWPIPGFKQFLLVYVPRKNLINVIRVVRSSPEGEPVFEN
jgi:plasmid stabilization system protein ParE